MIIAHPITKKQELNKIGRNWNCFSTIWDYKCGCKKKRKRKGTNLFLTIKLKTQKMMSWSIREFQYISSTLKERLSELGISLFWRCLHTTSMLCLLFWYIGKFMSIASMKKEIANNVLTLISKCSLKLLWKTLNSLLTLFGVLKYYWASSNGQKLRMISKLLPKTIFFHILSLTF